MKRLLILLITTSLTPMVRIPSPTPFNSPSGGPIFKTMPSIEHIEDIDLTCFECAGCVARDLKIKELDDKLLEFAEQFHFFKNNIDFYYDVYKKQKAK